jgi:hypothetical protein
MRLKLIVGENDLATMRPDLVAEWHPEKNGDLGPNEVTFNSSKNVNWICSLSHEWQTRVKHRFDGSGCPVCAGQRTWPGFNDLATTNPELVAEWHPTKNGDLTPSDVMVGSHKKVWWLCAQDHAWIGSVGYRAKGSGCAVCAGQKVWPGFNDLATMRPDLASEWHPTKNGDLKPSDVIAGTNKRLWWICKLGHEWPATGNTRDFKKSNCPYCGNKRLLRGFNDLATVDPTLAAEWHPTKNGDLKPSDVINGSHRNVWWLCAEGHEWPAKCSMRNSGRGCPKCAKYGFNPEQLAVLYLLVHDGYQARKIGITNLDGTRLGRFQQKGWQPRKVFDSVSGDNAMKVERNVFAWLRKDCGLPVFLGRSEMGVVGGWTETFSLEGPSDAEVIARIEAEFARIQAES